jgi:hypothetical protein
MNQEFRTQMYMSQLLLEKVVLDTRIQRAVLASQRLGNYDSELSEMQNEILAYRKVHGREPVFLDKSGLLPKAQSSKKIGISIPEKLARKLYAWFSGR